jgi:hypothetical protein
MGLARAAGVALRAKLDEFKKLYIKKWRGFLRAIFILM